MSVPAAYGGAVYLLDNSAWVRINREKGQYLSDFAAAVRAGQLRTCAVCKIEILYSTQTSQQFEEWREALDAIPEIAVTRTVCNAAVMAMAELAARSDGNHRVELPDTSSPPQHRRQQSACCTKTSTSTSSPLC